MAVLKEIRVVRCLHGQWLVGGEVFFSKHVTHNGMSNELQITNPFVGFWCIFVNFLLWTTHCSNGWSPCLGGEVKWQKSIHRLESGVFWFTSLKMHQTVKKHVAPGFGRILVIFITHPWFCMTQAPLPSTSAIWSFLRLVACNCGSAPFSNSFATSGWVNKISIAPRKNSYPFISSHVLAFSIIFPSCCFPSFPCMSVQLYQNNYRQTQNRNSPCPAEMRFQCVNARDSAFWTCKFATCAKCPVSSVKIGMMN